MRKLRKASLLALFIVISAAALTAALTYYVIRRPLPKQEGELVVQGMQDAITIYRDSWGVPHAYAANPYDLFFAQGYVHAQDRWWQMDLSRRLGRGTLSALFGENEALQAADRLARTLGWEQLAQANYDASSFETRAVLHAYAAGVNAYIAGRAPGDLAVEYTLLGLRLDDIAIEPWTPLDTLAWLLALQWQTSGNVTEEITRAQALIRVDDAMLAYYTPSPASATPILSAADLGLPDAAPPPDRAALPLADYTRLPLAEALAGLDRIGPRTLPDGTAWVVAGALTATGGPLLAAAPSYTLQVPSPWYEVGLYCIETPELCAYNLAGLSVPGVPGVFNGHNGRAAWALNNAWIDEQDLLIVRLNPANRRQYAWDGGWREMTTREETLAINGADAPQTFTVASTHLGPVIAVTAPLLGRDQALVVRWTALAAPADPLIALLKLNRAQSWDEARAALRQWTFAAQNVLYADAGGTIGYQLAGRVPLRAPGHSGLLPAPAEDSASEWRGLLPFDRLPALTNPPGGLIVAANNPSVPPQHPDAPALTSIAAPGDRAARIIARLQEHRAHSADTFAAIQADVLSPSAAAALPIVLAALGGDARLGEIAAWLGEWDARFAIDSPQAALFGAFWLRLAEYTYADELGAPPCDCFAVRQGLLALLDAPNHAWWDDVQTRFVVERRDAILRRALEQAIVDLTQAQGSDRDAWQWGALHTTTFRRTIAGQPFDGQNFAGRAGAGLLGQQWEIGPQPAGGTGDTLNTTRSAAGGRARAAVLSAPAARLIVDLAAPESSRAILSTGQSSHLASSHYRDMVDLWRYGEYHTVLWQRASIEAASDAMLALEPVYIPLATPAPPTETN